MPEDPVSEARTEAIHWYEHMNEFIHAGFSRDEAFELISAQWSAWKQAKYSARFFRGHEG